MLPNLFKYFQALQKLHKRYYNNTVNKLLFQFRYREHYDLPLVDWSQNPIVSAYTRIRPLRESQYYAHNEPNSSSNGPILNIPVPMLCNVFPEVCFTVDYSNSFHIDPNDRDFLSHSVITTPNTFFTHNKHTQGAFLIGRIEFMYSEANLYMIFSTAHVSHCTTIPSRITEIPMILRGEKVIKALFIMKALLRFI